MKLVLSATSTIREVKKQFNKSFPYLKLEFFTRGHRKGEPSSIRYMVDDKSMLLDITGVIREGVFYFEPSILTGDFEYKLQADFGIPVQVFRKSGGTWLETVDTDHISLEEQNNMAKASLQRMSYNFYTLFL